MKWVKVAIGAVIAIAVVPMIAISVFNLTQEQTKEEVVTFEVLTLVDNQYTITNGTFQSILNYSIIDGTDILNIIYIKLNDIESDTFDIGYYGTTTFDVSTVFGVDTKDFEINTGDLLYSASLTVGDTIEIAFEVTQAPILSGVTATLLLLAPLIFVSGILYFIYNNKQEGI